MKLSGACHQKFFLGGLINVPLPSFDHLIGLVVKASAWRAEDPGFESHLRWDFFGVESNQ